MDEQKNLTSAEQEDMDRLFRDVMEKLDLVGTRPTTEIDQAIYKYVKSKRWFEKTARPNGARSAKIIPVIVTEAMVGSGAELDPCGIMIQYWSLDGKLLAVAGDNGDRG